MTVLHRQGPDHVGGTSYLRSRAVRRRAGPSAAAGA